MRRGAARARAQLGGRQRRARGAARRLRHGRLQAVALPVTRHRWTSRPATPVNSALFLIKEYFMLIAMECIICIILLFWFNRYSHILGHRSSIRSVNTDFGIENQ